MVAYVTRMPQGIPGSISRQTSLTVEPQAKNSSLAFGSYGIPGKMAANKFVPIAAAGDAVYGFLMRPFPTQGANASDPLGTAVPAVTGIADVVRRGYINVHNNSGVPANNAAVFVRVANAQAGMPIGGVEAAFVGAGVGAANGGNTGNGTITANPVVTAAATVGVYTITMTAATAFGVADPSGRQLKNGATGVAYTAGGVTFTVTVGGTPMIAGDSFTVTVTNETQAIPGAIFESAADASGNVEVSYNI